MKLLSGSRLDDSLPAAGRLLVLTYIIPVCWRAESKQEEPCVEILNTSVAQATVQHIFLYTFFSIFRLSHRFRKLIFLIILFGFVQGEILLNSSLRYSGSLTFCHLFFCDDFMIVLLLVFILDSNLFSLLQKPE